MADIDNEGVKSNEDISNIAAFQVNQKKRKNIANVFSTLSELMMYRYVYKKFIIRNT